MIKVAILASGNGSNAENILQYSQKWPDKFSVAVVVTDNHDAGVIQRAEKFDVPCHILPLARDSYPTLKEAKTHQEGQLKELLKSEGVEWIFLAGYMRILSKEFLDSFFDDKLKVSRVVNIHPSLLPSFPGKNAYEQAYYSGVKMSGVTVHFVDSGVDTGPAIIQECFPRYETDSLDEFVSRGLETEYQLYRQAIRILIEKKFKLVPIEGAERNIVHIERSE